MAKYLDNAGVGILWQKCKDTFNPKIKGTYTLKQIWSGNQSVIPYSQLSEAVSNTWLLFTVSGSAFNYSFSEKIAVYFTNINDNCGNTLVWLYSTGQQKFAYLSVITYPSELSARIQRVDGGVWQQIENMNITKIEKMEITG